MKIGDDHCWIKATPADEFRLSYQLKYEHPNIGRQEIELVVTPESFVRDLANARTFILEQQANQLLDAGFGKRVSYQDVLVFGDQGPIENELRFADECVRHKALDLVGDFALAPFDLKGHIHAYRSGHRLNAQMVRRLLQEGHFVGSLSRAG